MALILEVLREDGSVAQRLRIEQLPIGIGRALDNQLVLDDPYVDAHHAEIQRAANGDVLLQDLGSMNLLATPSGGGLRQVAVAHDAVVTIGRATLRFRDEHADVAPPLPLSTDSVAAGASATQQRTAWYQTSLGRVGIFVTMLGVVGADLWLDVVDRAGQSQVPLLVLVAAGITVGWAGAWSLLARVVKARFRFLDLLTASAAANAVSVGFDELGDWGAFLFPDNPLVEVVAVGLQLVLLAALLATLLALAAAMTRRARVWSAVLGATAVLMVYGVIGELEDSEFSAVATFSGEIKPMSTALLPTDNAKALHGMAVALQADVDAMLGDEGR